MIPQTDLSLRGGFVMRSRSNRQRPRLEHLEGRCTPGSALDVLGEPLLAPLGQSPVFSEASETGIARLLAAEQTLSMSSQVACPVSRFTPADPRVPGPVGWLAGSDLQTPPAPPPGAAGADTSLLAAASLSQGHELELASPAPAGEQVPFRGRLEGVVTVTPVDPPIVSVLVNGRGNATQLGEFTVAIPHLVDRSTRTATGSYRFTAANGDTLTADFSGQATPTATPGVLHIVETATITGGTGRFAGATGGFTVERLFDSVAGTTTGSFDGTISSPGAGHP
jgi:hypothetical protein